MGNKIYILHRSYGFNGGGINFSILGMYSSKAKAEESKDAYEQQNDIDGIWDYYDVRIKEYTLDSGEQINLEALIYGNSIHASH